MKGVIELKQGRDKRVYGLNLATNGNRDEPAKLSPRLMKTSASCPTHRKNPIGRHASNFMINLVKVHLNTRRLRNDQVERQ